MSKVAKPSQKTEAADKPGYKIMNWAAYNAALKDRGSITLYFGDDVQANWYSQRPLQRGAQPVYSDMCMETLIMLKVVFKLAYRQTQGFAESLLTMMNLEELEVPSYSQINRRASKLKVKGYAIPARGPMVVAIDSTGIKVYGEGEWKVRKHGYSKRRTWRKLHLAVDPATGYIHSHTLTENDKSDDAQLETLIDQIEAPISQACCDGAYDTVSCWDKLIAEKIEPTIPPKKNAVRWYENLPGDLPNYPRNIAIDRINELGRAQWKKEAGYHQRSLAETAMFRLKTIHGGQFYSRSFKQQQTEMALKIKALNLMTAQGMPVSQPKTPA
jgi:hypothetical protein